MISVTSTYNIRNWENGKDRDSISDARELEIRMLQKSKRKPGLTFSMPGMSTG